MFFVLNKSQSVTHVFTCSFQGLFKNIVFRSVALARKKVMGYFRFFSNTDRTFYLVKVEKFHGDSVKNKRVLGQKATGGCQTTPPPAG